MVALIIGAIIIAIIIFSITSIYNGLVRKRNFYENSYAQIDVQLKRRYDLIPNLVNTAKGFMKHERETLEAVIKARNSAMSASDQAAKNPGEKNIMAQLAGAEGALTGALGKLFALSESYPELKSNEQMNQVMEELTSTENKISFARQAYNDSITSYNNALEVFPAVLIANNFGFKSAELLDVIEAPEERKVVKVSFD